MSEDEAHARATSSMTITVAIASAPGPAVGLRDVHRGQLRLGQRLVHVPGELAGLGRSPPRAGAILSSARARTASRSASCSSDRANGGKINAHNPMVGRAPERPGAASAGPTALAGPRPQGSALGQRLVPQLLLKARHPGQQCLVSRRRGCGRRAAPALRAPPTATVATGMPAGIGHDGQQRVEPVQVRAAAPARRSPAAG